VDEQGNHIETTNRTKLPHIENIKKAELLDYELYGDEMPITNPALLETFLEKKYND